MKDLQPNILDDYEHRIPQLMALHHDDPAFPTLEQYHISQVQLDDYLFDYQSVLDSEGSARAQQTFYGIIVVLPVILMSAFPASALPFRSELASLLCAVGVGALIAATVKTIRVMIKIRQLKQLRSEQPEVAAFADAVWQYNRIKVNH